MTDLFNPWVMRAAWQRTRNWYASGEMYDSAEYLEWQLDPWAKLARLAAELSSGEYCPSPFPVVPYPKRNDRTRHYVIPSVKDQVAFMAFLVLLGPFFEARMPNVSFGNRLHRRRVLANSSDGKSRRWYRGPFSLSQSRVYDSFASGYGLFRRLLQWVVNATVMTESAQVSGHDELADVDSLPYIAGSLHHADSLVYARLDLSLAYPSVDRAALGRAIRSSLSGQCQQGWGRPSFPDLVTETDGPFSSWLEYPRKLAGHDAWHALSADGSLRLALGDMLSASLNQIKYHGWREPAEWLSADLTTPGFYRKGAEGKPKELERFDSHGLWPHDCDLESSLLSSGRFGIPTGLALSGALLNVLLTPTDDLMCGFYDSGQPKEKVHYLRFVDDMVLLSPSPTAMGTAIRALRESLSTTSPTFKLHPEKAEPDSVTTFLTELRTNANAVLEPLDTELMTRANADVFATALVRQMSGLADEALEESFGPPGVDRLNELIEMASRNDHDTEVEDDARLSFAVNKIASASWPTQDIIEDGKHISPELYEQQIMLCAERALRRHPWRFKLWRSVIVIAVRAGDVGAAWLANNILPLIAWDNGSFDNWEHAKSIDSECCETVAARRLQHRRLRCSYQRAWFWRQITECMRALKLVSDGADGRTAVGLWTSHLSGKDAREALLWLQDLPRWTNVLYGHPVEGYWSSSPFFWWWEAEALAGAALGSLPVKPEVLRALGGPSRERLRTIWAAAPEVLSQVAFPPATPALSGAREAITNILAYEGMASCTVSSHDINAGLSVAWATCCYGMPWSVSTDFSLPEYRGLTPGKHRNPLDWAAVARLGLWDGWDMRHDIDVSALPVISDPEPWKGIRLLDTYAHVRRVLLAHGADVRWSMFRHWFSSLPLKRSSHTRSTSLLEALYRLDQPKAPPDAHVPAIELDPFVAWSLMRQLRPYHPLGSFASPDTVLLTANAFSALLDSRCNAILHGTDQHTAVDATEDIVRPLCSLLKMPRPIRGVGALTAQTRAPHPLYLFPEVVLNLADLDMRDSWRNALLLLWLCTGAEHVLDDLYVTAPWNPPLSDRDSLRSRVALPQFMWEYLERALGSAKSVVPSRIEKVAEEQFYEGPYQTLLSVRDVHFSDSGEWQVMPPGHTSLSRSDLGELKVRLVQGAEMPDDDIRKWARRLKEPARPHDRTIYRSLSAEIAQRLTEASDTSRVTAERKDHLLVFPEWYMPASYVPKLKQYVRETGIAILTGLLVAELPHSVPAVSPELKKGWRVLVNDAVLILPGYDQARKKNDMPSRVFEFRIRKPCPNVNELGLAKYLSDKCPDSHPWTFLAGMPWYRFGYRDWGSFSVAICSDVLDTTAWDWLRGRIQHLFISAWNLDVDLFDQVTWARGYELYSNVVTANHGTYGGSVAWTPRHDSHKEILRLHGADEGLAVSVLLPVAKLIEAQIERFGCDLKSRARDWGGDEAPPELKFKSPPPSYRYRGKR